MIRRFASNTILAAYRDFWSANRVKISRRRSLVCVSKNELSDVWSSAGVVYFYYTLWHTNWPNVFLWRINYWLSDRRTWKICSSIGWCSSVSGADPTSLAELFIQQNSTLRVSLPVSSTSLLLASRPVRSTDEEFLLPYRQKPNEIRAMLKHGNWLLILLNNKFSEENIHRRNEWLSMPTEELNFGDQWMSNVRHNVPAPKVFIDQMQGFERRLKSPQVNLRQIFIAIYETL